MSPHFLQESSRDRVAARRVLSPLDDEGLPEPSAWAAASPVAFCADWRGEHPDPDRETQVRLLWTGEALFVRFQCRYRDIHTYEGAGRRRDRLWLKDVAEIFIRPGREDPRRYKEFEISPNGDFLDLDISPGRRSILFCDLHRRVAVESAAPVWTAELAIPMDCLAPGFDPGETWRLNLFRIEGKEPDRFYSAWCATHTPQPNFHVPECFGELRFC
jgi:alpha-galactosidase